MSIIYYLSVISKDGRQMLVNSQTGNEKELAKYLTEGWVLQQKQEFTSLAQARETKRLLSEGCDWINGRMIQ